MQVFERYESRVRSYCRAFPTVFARARGASLWDVDGTEYIDFFAGAGTLNYGHNEPYLKERLLEYLSSDRIVHSLDMATEAKAALLDAMQRRLLAPRGLDYKVMFPGPTGTNAVEAALKLARKVTGREQVVAFTNAFHGMTLGSLALTGNREKRAAAGVQLPNVIRAPFDGYHGDGVDSVELLEEYLTDPSSGVESPAAFVLETVQGEGGVNAASCEWLVRIERLARRVGALLIVDDIQVGCGRTGPFFSFEPARIRPDIVCLSKSLSGLGLPLAVVLISPQLDVWSPGEHNGTFRGHNPAFVTATAALERFWSDDRLQNETTRKAEFVHDRLQEIAQSCGATTKGRGLIQGIRFDDDETARAVSRAAFDRGLVIETAGPRDEVLKILPPLTIDETSLTAGLTILAQCVEEVLDRQPATSNAKQRSEVIA